MKKRTNYFPLLLIMLFMMSFDLSAQKVEVIKAAQLYEMIDDCEAEVCIYNFWATWCAPCIKEMPHFEKMLYDNALLLRAYLHGWQVTGHERYRQVVEAYLPALIRSVRAYDERGKIPQYLVFLDQMFYQANRGWLWLDLLQDPLRHELDLPDEFQVWQDSVAALQNTLREAVADSRLLQSQALHFGDTWIRNVVKVHVNITNHGLIGSQFTASLPFSSAPSGEWPGGSGPNGRGGESGPHRDGDR